MKIVILIVLYNDFPKEYIFTDKEQHIIIVDNTPNRNLQLSDNIHIEYIPLGRNEGIARALNIGCKMAIKLGADWCLTMDQDSDLPEDMILKYKNFISHISLSIGIISPLINMYKGEKRKGSNSVEEIDEAITSGSLINLEAFQSVGGFKEEMFIDCVDFEFCWNLKSKGYKILQLNNIVMQHQLGNTREFKFFSKHLFYITHHDFVRHYYMQRNGLYVSKLYWKQYPQLKISLRKQIISIMKILLFENDRVKKLKAKYQGYKDFKNNKMGEYNCNI